MGAKDGANSGSACKVNNFRKEQAAEKSHCYVGGILQHAFEVERDQDTGGRSLMRDRHLDT